MKTRRHNKWRIGLLLIALLVSWAPPAFPAANTIATLNSGGCRQGSANYRLDGSIESISGLSTASSPGTVIRPGYAGQLYDVKNLQISAAPANVNEVSTSQLSAVAIMDDTTVLLLATTGITWGILAGPITNISATGLAAATNVHQDTAATLQATYQSAAGALVFTVLNVGNDDFGMYAGDGVNDAWQVRYFGQGNTNAAANADPDVDGMSNYYEYLADTDPTNAFSCFRLLSVSNTTHLTIAFQSSSNRSYYLYASTNLMPVAWTNIPSRTNIPGTGSILSITDPSTAIPQGFYRVGVRLP